RIRATEFEPLILRIRTVNRNSNGSAAVSIAVRQIDRRLIPRHQSFVAIRRGTAKCHQSWGVVEYPPHRPNPEIGQSAIPRSREEPLTMLPKSEIQMDATPRIVPQALRHECCRFTTPGSDVLHDIFVPQ